MMENNTENTKKCVALITNFDDNPLDVTKEVNFIWNIANKLRGTYQPEKYKEVIIPMIILRRFECALEKTKDEVFKILERKPDMPEQVLEKVSGCLYFNRSRYTLKELLTDPDKLVENLKYYINQFSSDAREIFEYLDFGKQIDKMAKSGRLFAVVKSFSELDLDPVRIDTVKMGYMFEDLIRRFSENAEAGDHYTGRDVTKLANGIAMASGSDDILQGVKVVNVMDQACGTGGMLSTCQNYILHINPNAIVNLYGQEVNPESYAICKAEMLIRGQKADNIRLQDSLQKDCFGEERKMRYVVENPPFGTAWGGKDAPEGTEAAVVKQFEEGKRYVAGLPGKGDAQLLFIQSAIDKLDPENGRATIITNGSPLFTGGTTSGESQIRKWLLDNDRIEAIIALPTDLFYNTGIGTYINVYSMNKAPERKGKIQLIDASGIYHTLRKPLGKKKNEISKEDREKIISLYANFEENDLCKIFDKEEFIYREYTIMRPMTRNYAFEERRIQAMKEANVLSNVYDEAKIAELEEKSGIEGLTKKEVTQLNKLKNGKADYDTIFDALEAASKSEEWGSVVWASMDSFIPVLKKLMPKVNGKNMDKKMLEKIALALSVRDESAMIEVDKKGNIIYDPETKDTEIVKGTDTIEAYMEREVLPHIPDAAWFFEEDLAAKKPVIKTGAEIPFTRYFFKYERPEALEALQAKILAGQSEIEEGLGELFE